jgi:hypothetical protein
MIFHNRLFLNGNEFLALRWRTALYRNSDYVFSISAGTLNTWKYFLHPQPDDPYW